VTVYTAIDEDFRPHVMESLGSDVFGAAPPHPDSWDQNTAIYGVFNRICTLQPNHDKALRKRFTRFVRDFVNNNFVPFDPSLDISVDWWLENTSYPGWRKIELYDAIDRTLGVLSLRDFICKCFVKDETYMGYKHARAIFSRSDAFKAYAGPIFKRIEEVVYEHPSFIKHIPIPDRPGYITNMCYAPGAKYAATDYTSYESHFTKSMMEDCEFILYDHMVSCHPEASSKMKVIKKVLSGRNKCLFKRFNLTLDATRMSGEMCTSLGNGFANLMFFLFACHEEGIVCKGVVEGDDGLFACTPRLPNKQTFENLGLTIKIDEHYGLETASFCGIIYDRMDNVNVTDPREILVNFGWSKTKYVGVKQSRKLELLRAKSLSFAYQYRGCPIVQSLAHYGLRVTRHIDLRRYINKCRSLSQWERDQLIEAMNWYSKVDKDKLKMSVPMNTRLLVQTQFDISLEHQIIIERYLDNLQTLQQLDLPEIYINMPEVCKDYFAKYVSYQESQYPVLNVPLYRGQLRHFQDNLRFSQEAINNGTRWKVLKL